MIELGNEDDAVIRCGLEAPRLFFRLRAQICTGAYKYRAGRYMRFLCLCCLYCCSVSILFCFVCGTDFD